MSDVLVIGSGPAGLAIATCLKRLGVGLRLVDRYGHPGGAYRRMYGAITLSSPAAFLGLPRLPFKSRRAYVNVDEYNAYLETYAHRHGIQPEAANVLSIERDAEGYLVRLQEAAGRSERFCAVIVATGMSDHPLFPDIPGLDACAQDPSSRIIHSHNWRGPLEYRDARLLIVGGGMRAVEIAEECAAAGLPVAISARRKIEVSPHWRWFDARSVWFPFTRYLPSLPLARKRHCDQPITFKPIDHGYAAHLRAGLIRERTELLGMESGEAIFKAGQREKFDAVVLATGYRHLLPFLPREVARSETGFPLASRNESSSWPGLYFLGSPCAGGAYSQFIHGIRQDAPRLALRIWRRLHDR